MKKFNPTWVLQATKRERNIAYVQRLGWLLAKAGQNGLVEEIVDWLKEQKPRETPLDPASPRKGFSRDPKWKVIVNAEVEGEL